MELKLINTKIVATTGPACMQKKELEALAKAGVSVFRLNFAHGDYEEKTATIKNIREIERKLKRPLAIFADLQGPKIRLGKIKGGYAKLNFGQEFIFTGEQIEGDEKRASISHPEILKDLEIGREIYINDGLVKLEIKRRQGADIVTKVIDDGEISDSRGVNFPGSKISIPAITAQDKRDLEFAIRAGVDFVALSFVRSPAEIEELKGLMREAGKILPIISKIEKWEAMENLESIVEASDMVMIARGDLGVELPFEKIPMLQKKIAALCQEKGKPVITATQMLISMVNNPAPTRAEVTDISNAILDGTDAVMLSNETAMGRYPVKSVETMAKIIESTESSDIFRSYFESYQADESLDITKAIARSTTLMAKTLSASLIVCATETANTAMLISRYRQKIPILALSPNEEALKKGLLMWGVIPRKVKAIKSSKQFFALGAKVGSQLNLAKKGDLIIMTCGTHAGVSGNTNLVKAEKI